MHPKNDEAAEAIGQSSICECGVKSCEPKRDPCIWPDMHSPAMQVAMIEWLRVRLFWKEWSILWTDLKLTRSDAKLADALIEAVLAARDTKP